LLTLTAPPGLGKTMLLYQLLGSLERSARTVFLFHSQCSGRGLLRQIVGQLGESHDTHDAIAMHAALRRILLEEEGRGRRVVLIVDEAHNLAPGALETIRLLSDFETPARKLLQIVLAGQQGLAVRLLEPELAGLKQRIATIARIEALGESEVPAYVRHRIEVAGQGEPIFDDEALRLVAHLTRGVPREINNLLSDALRLGCAIGARPVGASVIQEVQQDRDLAPQRPREADRRVPVPVRPALAGFVPRRATTVVRESPIRQRW
jgi:general secretion pathway protein A